MHHLCPAGCSDPLYLLPAPVSLSILSLLSPTDLATASRVCSNWRDLALTPSLWQALCRLSLQTIERRCSLSSFSWIQASRVQTNCRGLQGPAGEMAGPGAGLATGECGSELNNGDETSNVHMMMSGVCGEIQAEKGLDGRPVSRQNLRGSLGRHLLCPV